jgi:hypothetical protein
MVRLDDFEALVAELQDFDRLAKRRDSRLRPKPVI